MGSGMTYHNMSGFGRNGAADVAEHSGLPGFGDHTTGLESQKRQTDPVGKSAGSRLAHPREDHLIPLMVVAGAAAADVGRETFVDRVFNVPTASSSSVG